jgi:hypothetical protein
MPGFADSFWSGDYAGGLGVLFAKLNQGTGFIKLRIFRLRADRFRYHGEPASSHDSEHAGGR